MSAVHSTALMFIDRGRDKRCSSSWPTAPELVYMT